jgi:hypothetical protein
MKPTTGFPVITDDATIAKALEDANTPSLMMALIHLTGDARRLLVRHAGSTGR